MNEIIIKGYKKKTNIKKAKLTLILKKHFSLVKNIDISYTKN